MNKIKFHAFKIFIKTRGISLFLFFFLFPQICSVLFLNLLNFLNKFFKFDRLDTLLKDETFSLLIFTYIFFFILFSLIHSRLYRVFYFIKKEDWLSSFSKALIPTIISFGTGYIVTYSAIFLFDKLPLSYDIKSWMNNPNIGISEISSYIDQKNYIKVLILFFVIIVFTPILEEIVFRGFLQDSMEKFFGKYNLDIIIVALIFGLFHYESLSNIIFSSVLGIFLSWQRKNDRSINVTVWMHGIVNFTGILALLIFKYLNLKNY